MSITYHGRSKTESSGSCMRPQVHGIFYYGGTGKHCISYTNNRKRLSVPCYFLAPCDKRKHTAHAHQQAASQASTDSAGRHHVWLPHSSLGFQRPVGRRSYRLTPQATIAQSAIVAYNTYTATQISLDNIRDVIDG